MNGNKAQNPISASVFDANGFVLHFLISSRCFLSALENRAEQRQAAMARRLIRHLANAKVSTLLKK